MPVWEMVEKDYQRHPVKPVLDGEPNYEDAPASSWPKWDPVTGCYRDHDVRKQLYRSVFAGACGVTYGHTRSGKWLGMTAPVNFPDRDWRAALDRPAAGQVQFLHALVESRPFLSRIPDQSLIVGDPGIGGSHLQATRDEAGSYAFIYFPRWFLRQLTWQNCVQARSRQSGTIHATVRLKAPRFIFLVGWWNLPCRRMAPIGC